MALNKKLLFSLAAYLFAANKRRQYSFSVTRKHDDFTVQVLHNVVLSCRDRFGRKAKTEGFSPV